MTTENNTALEKFIIDAKLISPITDIVKKLKEGNFRDCDIKWLDDKLEVFIKFAAETLGVSGLLPSQLFPNNSSVLNEYTKNQYIEKFQKLLDYFKSF